MEAAHTHLRYALEQAPRLLGLLDREPQSPSAGSFDREHWSWKFRDFPLGMMQTAVYPLALLWARPHPQNPYHRNEHLLGWIAGAFRQTLSRQHSNGAFDAFAPFEQDPGPTLGVMHGHCEAYRLLGSELPAPLAQQFLAGLRKACDFALSRDNLETHAFISNHWALFAVTFLDAHEFTGDARYRTQAGRVIERILAEQSPEGWYNEYGGPDPGYESLGLHHLATYWERTGDARLLDSLRRSVEFYAHCVHPDGSVGGAYGSRHTSLYFPGGFAKLAAQVPMAAAIVRFMAARLERGNVVTPQLADPENLIPLLYSFLEAAHAPAEPVKSVTPLPCESLNGVRRFESSGITVAGEPSYYAVVNTNKGGVCRIFNRLSETPAYEDASYLLRADGALWTAQLAGMSEDKVCAAPSQVGCRARFCRVREMLPTPFRFLVLRMLNLTLFRSLALGNWLRNIIIRRLILARRPGPFRLERTISFLPDEVQFVDSLQCDAPEEVQELVLPRGFTGIHMGSSKYFHSSELEPTQPVALGAALESLKRTGRAEVRFAVSFSANRGPAFSQAPSEEVAHR